jgi:hypothetical protein
VSEREKQGEVKRLTRYWRRRFPDREVEIIPCRECGALTSVEALSPEMPREGEKCHACDVWLCFDCWLGHEAHDEED